LFVQILGLYIGNEYISLIEMGVAEPVFESPENIGNSLFLFSYMIVATGVMILIIKYKKILIRVIEIVVTFTALFLTFDFLIPVQIFYVPVSFVIALILIIWRTKRPNFYNQNLSIAFALPSIGAVIGVSLGIVPSLLLIVLISAYDFVSVFITKHMIYMAKEVAKVPTSFALSMPHKFKKPVVFKVGKRKVKKKYHVFQLGSGDLVIPLIFSSSVLATFSLWNALLTILGSGAALILIIYFATKKRQPLPAIPLISVGTLAGFLISLVI